MLLSALLVANISACNVDVSENNNDTKPESEQTLEENQTSSEVLYNEALALLQQGKLEEAYTIFLTLKNYKDVVHYLNCFAFEYKQKVYEGRPDIYYEYDEYGKVTYEYHTPLSISGYSHSYEYDENQRLIKDQYASDSGKQSIKLYEYDAVGNLTKQTDIDGDTVYVTSVEFDERGNKTRVISDEYNITIEYQYDGANNLLEMLIRNKDGEVTEGYFYEYDSNNRLICKTSQYSSVTEVSTYEYDESGNTLSVVNENNGVFISRQDYEYDENGNRKKLLNSYTSDIGSVVLWIYDESGNVIEERHEENGKCLSCKRYEYDENGNCIKETSTEPTRNCSSQKKYEYDKWGNLLRIEYVDRMGENITTSYVVEYQEYKLYYNPYLTQKLPLYAGK